MKILNRLNNYKKKLFTVNNRPLTTESKIALGIYIIFMFFIIGIGVGIQHRNIKPIYNEYGYKCINLVNKYKDIKEKEENSDRIVKNSYYNEDHYRWSYNDFLYNNYKKYTIKDTFGTNKLCQELGKAYYNVSNDIEFKSRYRAIDRLKKELSNLQNISRKYEEEYGNMLLEKLVNQPKEKSILSSNVNQVKNQLDNVIDKIHQIEEKINYLEDLSTLNSFNNFIKKLENLYLKIDQNYKHDLRYYRLKVLFSIYIFLIPLFLVLYYLYKYSKKSGKLILSNLAINGANVAGIFILFYLIEFIFDIIPKTFFRKIIEWLSQYNLEIMLSIGGIVIFMIIFGLIIYKIQQNSKEQSKLPKNFLNVTYIKNGGCTKCGSHIDKEDIYCPNCGYGVKNKCKYCNSVIRNGIIYCTNCGRKLLETR